MHILNLVVYHVTEKNAPFVNTAVKIDASCPNDSSKTLAALIRDEVYKKKPFFAYCDQDIKSLETEGGIDIFTFLGDPFFDWGDFVTSGESKRNIIIAVIDPPLINSESEGEKGIEVKSDKKVASTVTVENIARGSNAERVKEENVKTEDNTKKIKEEDVDENATEVIIVDDSEEEGVKEPTKKGKEKKSSKKKKKKKKSRKEKKSVNKERLIKKEEIDSYASDSVPDKKRKSAAHTDEPAMKKATIAENLKTKCRVYVDGIRSGPTEDEVRQYFGWCGKITQCRMPSAREGRCSGEAIIQFETEDAIENCMTLNGSDFGGGQIRVCPMKKPEVCTGIFVRGLPHVIGKKARIQALQKEFGRCGEIVEIHASAKNASIYFVDCKSADVAVQMVGAKINGKPVIVEYIMEKKPVGCTTVFVKGLPHDTDKDALSQSLRQEFSRCGKIDTIKSGNSKDTTIIQFVDSESADAAVKMVGPEIIGKVVRIRYYLEEEEKRKKFKEAKVVQQKKNMGNVQHNAKKKRR